MLNKHLKNELKEILIMKRTLLITLCCLFSIIIQAQTEHLKFMGIPLDGSISAFQSKLQAKGIKYDAESSRQLKAGCRSFKGSFSGEKADFYVYYNEKTKVVYRAKAVITCFDKERGEEKFYTFRSMLKTKYSDGIAEDGEQEGHPALSILVPDSKQEKGLGYVSMYINNPPYSFMDEVYLHIDYEDASNRMVNQENIMEDL